MRNFSDTHPTFSCYTQTQKHNKITLQLPKWWLLQNRWVTCNKYLITHTSTGPLPASVLESAWSCQMASCIFPHNAFVCWLKTSWTNANLKRITAGRFEKAGKTHRQWTKNWEGMVKVRKPSIHSRKVWWPTMYISPINSQVRQRLHVVVSEEVVSLNH